MANNNAPKSNSVSNNAPKSNSVSNNAPKANSVNNNAPKANSVSNNAPKANSVSNNAPKANSVSNNAPKANSVNNNAPKANSVNNVAKNIQNNQLRNIQLQGEITEGLMDKIDELRSSNKIYKYLGIISIIIILIIVGVYIYRTKKEKSEVKVFIEKQESQNKYQFENDFVPLPKNGYDYTINFWFYLTDYYENYNKWRHILHKGTLDNSNFEYSDWNNLTQEIQEQSPGIWLHPNKNNIRIAFTVELNKDYCSTNEFENTCIEKSYCSWDGLLCKPKKEHAFTDMEDTKYNDTDKVIIEYVDIENIPSKTMINIGFTLEEKILNVYVNGKLHKIKKFLGVPVFNREDLHFNIKDTYGGIIYNFRYISNTISAKKMLYYYNNIPNVDKFSKKYRIQKYASMYQFDKLLKTLFV
jgi:hypothetical protein